jgi:hypothetical protein
MIINENVTADIRQNGGSRLVYSYAYLPVCISVSRFKGASATWAIFWKALNAAMIRKHSGGSKNLKEK